MHIGTLEHRPTSPFAAAVEAVCKVVQAGGALEDVDRLMRDWVVVPERRNHALRVDLVRPLRFSVDHGDHVGALHLLGQDQRFDVIYIRCLVGCKRINTCTEQSCQSMPPMCLDVPLMT